MKSVRDMNDFEFQRFVGVDRLTAQQMILGPYGMSPIPDRPMHPKAKMSGGDRPIWDDRHADRIADGTVQPGEMHPDDIAMKNEWLNMNTLIRNVGGYHASNGCSYGMQSVSCVNGVYRHIKSMMKS